MQKYYQQVYIKKYENIYKNTYYMIFQVKYSSTWDERGGLDRWSVFRLKAVWFVYKDVSFVARKNAFHQVFSREKVRSRGKVLKLDTLMSVRSISSSLFAVFDISMLKLFVSYVTLALSTIKPQR